MALACYATMMMMMMMMMDVKPELTQSLFGSYNMLVVF